MEVLKWARGEGCPWDRWTCAFAAGGGHLEVLKWAREHGCPWDELICKRAAGGWDVKELKWEMEDRWTGGYEYDDD